MQHAQVTGAASGPVRSAPAASVATGLASAAILVLGMPRSGTSWLGKILDSHPDVLYRHEPDEVVPARPDAHPSDQLREWISVRGVHTATKAPFFRKSWLPTPLAAIRNTMAYTFNGTARLVGGRRLLNRLKLPDFVALNRNADLRAAIKLVGWDGSGVCRALPGSRTLFLLRHPCGQVASVLRGGAQGRFEARGDGSDPRFDESAAAKLAASRGVDATAFRALPDAAKCAWTWLAFNEVALAGLTGLPNARIVLYEDLCARPEAVTRALFEFVGLSWNPQTEAFINRSVHYDGPSGYYDVFRNSAAAAERWRTSMDQADQHAVRDVIRGSPLAQNWPDLADPV
jgi:LPS sulfotransferase NodH